MNQPMLTTPAYGQRALWFLHNLAPTSGAYHVAHAACIRSAVEVPALERALQRLTERHDALRTTFAMQQGELFQQVYAQMVPDFCHVAANGWSQGEVEERLNAEAWRPFDLERGPLVRALVLTVSDREHYFLLVIHHIVTDFWAMAVLLRELGETYAAEVEGRAYALPDLRMTYLDYVVGEQAMLRSAQGERHWLYWQQRLAGPLPVLDLPTAAPRPPLQTDHGAVHWRQLSDALTRGLKAVARQHGVTLYTLLLTTFQVLLHRYSGQDDIIVGAPAVGRRGRRMAELVGYCVNPVPLRSDLSGNPTFAQLLAQVGQTVRGAMAHQQYPFLHLVERLEVERDPSRSPLFSTMYTHYHDDQVGAHSLAPFALGIAGQRLNLGGLELESVALRPPSAQFDLSLTTAELATGMALVAQYHTDRFDAEAIERMIDHFQALLMAVVADPNQRIGEMPLLSAAERQQLLVAWNQTAVEYPRERCVHELFEQQAERRPDAVALVYAHEQLTYGELNRRANRLAHHLRKLGVGPEMLVAICMERSLEMIVGLLGILKAGGAYLPLDPTYPAERLRDMLQDSGAALLLTNERLARHIAPTATGLVLFEQALASAAPDSEEKMMSGVTADNLAYVIYTSGSTGRPKGVQLLHGGLLNLVHWHQRSYRLTPADRTTQLAGVGFDASVWEVWSTLVSGASLYLPEREALLEPVALRDWLIAARMTVSFLPTPLAEPLLALDWPADASLRTLLTGGDRLRTFAPVGVPFDLVNHYGPTETTVVATAGAVPMQCDERLAQPSIGRPIDNMHIYILDRHLQPVPVGLLGELCIAGDGLARGYLNRPDLTAEAFVPNPFGERAGERLYRTGDRARYLPDGQIECMGRIDHQVKIRGFRVELGEIEAVLAQHPGLSGSVVTAHADASGATRLVAYAIPAAGAQLQALDLQAHLKKRLPDYMLPTAIVLLERMPLTPNGKIDRKALPAPEDEAVVRERYVAPRNPIEERLAAIWAELLHLERVGANDHFFEIGGHSLLMTQVVSRIRNELRVEIELRLLFEAPTLSALAERVEAQMREQQGMKAPPLVPTARTGEIPLSFAQQRLWFLDQLRPGDPWYNIPIAVRLQGQLDGAALERSLQEIIRRHESLRTTFALVDGGAATLGPVSAIARLSQPVPVLQIDRLDLQAEPWEAALALARREANRPFDLTRDVMLRATLLRLADEEHLLLLTMHHIAADGWSMGVLVRELAALYGAFAAGKASPLPELPIQYADFTLWQRSWLQGAALARQLDYWRERLAGLTPLVLPTDRPRPTVQSSNGALNTFVLSPELTVALQALSRREGATLYMTLLAAFYVLLHRYSRQDDIAVGTPIANRNREEIEGLIGFFVNTLVMRSDLSGNPRFRSLLGQVREAALDAYLHQDLPFDALVDALHPERSLSHNPLVQVIFALHNAPLGDLALPGLTLAQIENHNGTAKFDLYLALVEGPQGLSGTLEYRTDLFDATTAERLCDHYERILAAVARDPAQRIDDVALLAEAERQQVLVDWNQTAVDYPRDLCIHALFEQQAARTPDAVALVYEDEQLTYGELNQRANQLAHYLRKRGVEPEAPVGILIERSLEMIVGLLGILKAGGAYLPLDPDYPLERLAYMLQDGKAPLLLTQQHLRERLPAHEDSPICLDTDWPLIAQEPVRNLSSHLRADHLAYVMYTSGSTGRPKGVAVTHRSVVRLVQNSDDAQLDAERVFLQLAPISFDASTLEIWGALLNGARLVMMPPGIPSPEAIGEAIRRYEIDTLWLTAGLFHLMVSEHIEALRPLRQLLAGGEALLPAHVQRFLQAIPTCALINGYGPTENTTFTTCCRLTAAIVENGRVPIGRPIANTTVYVLDAAMQPVGLGIVGELYTGGDGLARGYLNRPDLTAERFVPNPFGERAGERLYRTGDLVRYLPDGNIEFVGRIDNQVKIRGYRIELGEIEAALSRHHGVAAATVMVRTLREEKQERQGYGAVLVAYVVPKHERAPLMAAESGGQVQAWQHLFEDTYHASTPDPTFHIAGWNSSYTGAPLPAEEMQEWVTETVRRIRSFRPRRVFEIGCGTGLLLFRLLDECDEYVGIDFSQTAIAHIRQVIASRRAWAERLDRSLHLRVGLADQLDWVPRGAFDVVIINSVVQYFPDGAYLKDVLRSAAEALAPGGHIFVGDIRHLGLLEVQHASIRRHRSGGDTPGRGAGEAVRAGLRNEEELLIDPRFFGEMVRETVGLCGCRVLPKRGRYRNELTNFRYDAILQAGEAAEGVPCNWERWSESGGALSVLRQRLQSEAPARLCLSRIANARVTADVRYLQVLQAGEEPVGSLKARMMDEVAAMGIDPEELWQLGEETGYAVELSWAAGYMDGSFDAVLTQQGVHLPPVRWPAGEAVRPGEALVHAPGRSRPTLTVTELRRYLRERLPESMIPSAFVLLDALPLTPNGKVDRKALPDPTLQRSLDARNFMPPRNEMEAQLAAIWSDLLGVSPIGVFDNFFELGGHSLLATRVVSRVREALQTELSLRSFFEAPTVAGLAAKVEAMQQAALDAKSEPVPTPIRPAERGGELPLSFAQQRLWFLDQLSAGLGPDGRSLQLGSAAYNMAAAVRLRGPLEIEALERSLQAIVGRHESLRTTFATIEGRPVQVINAHAHLQVAIVQSTAAVVEGLAQAEAQRPFNLSADLMLRATLLKLAEDDHVLLLTMHHIAGDGWSIGILVREVAAFYQAFTAGQAPGLPALPIQYVDFALWQRERLQGEVLEKQLAYWKERLSGLSPLELPSDRPRPLAPSGRGASAVFSFSSELTRALQALSQREGVTLFMTLLAAFQALLHRYTGQDDIAVGIPIANRNRAETEGLIGFFVNTLVMRSDLSGNPSFRELLRQVRQTALGAYQHQDLPFEQVVDALQPERNLNRNPLVQVTFALQNAPMGTPHLSGLQVEMVEVQAVTARFDLEVGLTETEEGLKGRLTYSTDLFDADRMQRLGAHLQRLLAAAVADPERRLAHLPLLSEAEQQQMLVTWNQTEQPYPWVLIQEIFERRVAQMDDATALLFEGTRITYRELNQRANQLAHYLRARGVGPEVLVGISMERSPRMVVAVLAVLKAGGAYVPLDPTYPQERIDLMLADTGISILLTQKRLVERFANGSIQAVALDADWRRIGRESVENPDHLGSPENLAYVIYTSGSTGQPKGVLLEHRAVCNFINTVQQTFAITPADRMLQFASLNFDVSVFEIFGALLSGATLVLARHETLISPEALTDLMRSERVTITDMPPAMMALLDAERFPAHRIVFVGGETFSGELVNRWNLPGRRFFNGYGPTESTVTMIIKECVGEWTQSPPIGVPMLNHQAYVLDRHMQPVPVGVPGELYIGGAGLARGYLHQPALTAERFVCDPFGSTPGARLYRTGDLVRYLANGDIEFLGRVDDQVKIRGFRIELGEIESALAQHPTVKQAAVMVREDMPGDKRLVAYVAGEEGALRVSELRSALGSRLPSYMIPAAFVLLPSLPLNASGKVDRRALPVPDAERPELEEEYAAPRTELEQVLVGSVFSKVLGIEQIGVHDNFFALGGNSLQATQIVSRVREAFKVDLPLRSLFEAPTVAEVAANLLRLQQAAPATAEPALTPIQALPRPAHLPLSFAQQRLWFMDQLSAGLGPDGRSLSAGLGPDGRSLSAGHAYHIPVAVRLTGRLDEAALERSFDAIIRRHESLRTTFAMVDERPVQVIQPPVAFRMLRMTAPTAAVRELAREEARRPFDLSRDLMLRATLVTLSDENDHVLLLTMHHIAGDGWSTGILIREVAAFYQAFTTGQRPNLPELPIQYADFALWQRAWLQEDVLARQLEYWKERLTGLSTLEMPTDRPRPAVQSSRGAVERLTFSVALTQALYALSRQEGATLFMTLLATFQTLLHRYTGQDEIVIGSPIANRNRAEIEGLIGFFVNTLVMRGNCAGRPSFRELLRRTREMALETYRHQDLPFEMLVDALKPERDLSHHPLFQVAFALQNAPVNPLHLEGLSLSPLDSGEVTTRFDLSLHLSEEASALSGNIIYNPDLFDRATIIRMIGHLRQLLTGIVSDPDQPLHALPLLTAPEREEILHTWNQTAEEYRRDCCVHQRIEEQAVRWPDRIAVASGEERLTYRELNARANQLARLLRRMGVEPEVLVGILVERSVGMMVGVLAVLKAGGAYVPFDPLYPPERIGFALSDASIPVLITESALLHLLPPCDLQILLLDRIGEEIATESEENLPNLATPQNLAYVIYTSGSTGRPKGVLIDHAGVLSLNLGFNRTVYDHLTHPIVASMTAPLVFDGSVKQWQMLMDGHTVHIIPSEVRQDAEAYVAYIRRHRLTAVDGTPEHHRALIAAGLLEEGAHRPEMVLSGGEAVDEALWRQMAASTSITFYNGYGPTEVSVMTSNIAVRQSPTQLTIGRPITGKRLYVLDRQWNPVPVGITGELYIGGEGLARGYLNRPELTAERFVPDPFGSERGARLYRTGDLVRYLEDGRLQFVGRADQQVKIRGYRIELGEIESVLTQHPQVARAVVAVHAKQLVAYLVLRTESGQRPPTAETLRRAMSQRLPDYMLPTRFILLERLPLMPNGKVDRKALPEPDRNAAAAGEYMAPRSPLEELLAMLWAEVLGRTQVGADENLFEIGGHSLLATQLVSRIRAALSVNLPLRTIFEAPTVAQLAQRIETLQRAAQGIEVGPIERAERNGPLPLSFAQQRLWFLDQLQPGGLQYHIPLAVRLLGQLDQAALERSLREVVRRHESLRTTFQAVEGEPLQRIGSEADFQVRVLDLQALADEQREAQVRMQLRMEGERPFDLSSDLPIRATLLLIRPQEALLMLTMHHIASDGWSMGIFVREMAAGYATFTAGRSLELPALPIQYADFARWQRQWLQGEVLHKQLGYWRERLRDLPVLELPTDRPRPAMQSGRGATCALTLSSELTQALYVLSRQAGATLFMTLMTAFQLLLHRYSGQDDIAVGTPIANRNRMEIEGLIGFFVNTLVIRSDLSGNPTFRELLAQVRQTALGAYMHQDLPFEMLVEALQPVRSTSHTPLFQAMFVLQNAQLNDIGLHGLTLRGVEVSNNTAKFDLMLGLAEGATGLTGGLNYNTDLFDASTISQMIKHFIRLLEAIVANPDQGVATLPLLAAGELQQLDRWNQTGAAYPQDRCIHQMVEAQVARTPDGVAVRYEEQRLTYAELNRRANRLAHLLQKRGAGPEVLVGICMERSLEMIIGLLAILKAGSAYLPLDPAYPQERLQYMQQEAGVHLVLTPEALRENEAALASESEENPQSGVRPENLAYVIYTSGSTGRPKGVQIEHRSLVNLLTAVQQQFAMTAADRQVAVTSLSFDVATQEIFLPLLVGAQLVVASRTSGRDGGALAALLAASEATILTATPSTWRLLVESGWQGEPRLRQISTGEALPRDLQKALLQRGASLWNLYGPTETTIWSTGCALTDPEAPVQVGYPIANTQIYVLDRQMQPVPVGVVGELYIGGDGLARGYRNRPDLTAERFVCNPFSAQPSARLYRTGDLARYLPSGSVEVLGRIDQQVKLRGYRIELGEIEATLMQCAEVQQAVVVMRREESGESRLVAYLITASAPHASAEGRTLTAAELRAHLSERLPDYMIPAVYVLLDAFPLTPSGKVDRRALPAPEPSERRGVIVAPNDALEQQIADLWAEVLCLQALSTADNFFAIGGHSLLAVRLMARLQRATGQRLPLALLYQAPTVQQMAAALRQQSWLGGASHLLSLQKGGAKRPLFLIHGIEGAALAFTELVRKMGPARPIYGLQSVGLDGEQAPLAQMELIVAQHGQAIRAVQPNGPYQLVGYSMGGVIAIEIARQLRQQGEEVALLALLDSHLPDPEARPAAVEPEPAADERSTLLALAQAVGIATADIELSDAQAQAWLKVIKANEQALRAHRVAPYDGAALLMQAANRPHLVQEAAYRAWAKVIVGDLQRIIVPGDHYTLLKPPHVDELAERLRAALHAREGEQ